MGRRRPKLKNNLSKNQVGFKFNFDNAEELLNVFAARLREREIKFFRSKQMIYMHYQYSMEAAEIAHYWSRSH